MLICLSLWKAKPGEAGIALLGGDRGLVKLQFYHISMRGEARRFFSKHLMCIFRVKHSTNMKISYILLLSYSNVTPLKIMQISFYCVMINNWIKLLKELKNFHPAVEPCFIPQWSRTLFLKCSMNLTVSKILPNDPNPAFHNTCIRVYKTGISNKCKIQS